MILMRAFILDRSVSLDTGYFHLVDPRKDLEEYSQNREEKCCAFTLKSRRCVGGSVRISNMSEIPGSIDLPKINRSNNQGHYYTSDDSCQCRRLVIPNSRDSVNCDHIEVRGLRQTVGKLSSYKA